MRRIYLVFVLLCGLGSNSYAEDEYAFILRARGNPYWNIVKQGIEETAKSLGIKALIYQGESDKASEEQLNICLTVIEKNPKFLAITAANPNMGIQCLKRAAERGIYVADIDSGIPIAEAEAQSLKLSFSVGSDNLAVGRRAANYAATLLQLSQPKVLILEGATGAVAGKQRVDGFTQELKNLIPNVNIVASLAGEWDRLKAMNITADIIQRDPNLNLVFAANDLMALGAVEALRNVDHLRKVKVVGVDGIAEARRAVINGGLAGTVAQLPYLIGKRAVELGVDVINGKSVPQIERTETPILTKDSIENKSTPFIEYIR